VPFSEARAGRFTLKWLIHSYFGVSSSNNETPVSDPGKRTGGFDFSYRLPWLRNWLTIYTDSLADDHPSRTLGSGSEFVSPYCAVCASTVPFKSNSTLTE